jgi:hypothetical protein
METETIAVLEKVSIRKEKISTPATTGCCGGTPTNNADACCKLDEDKKAEGEEGCGCNSKEKKSTASSCC